MLQPSSTTPVQPVSTSVLIVDDEESAVEELLFALRSTGIPAVGATGAKEAIELFVRDPSIGVVVSDIRMPMQDGVEFVSRLRKCGARGEDCEIIFVTGYPEFETAVGALENRVSKYFLKPLETSELLVAISQSIAKYADAALARKGRAIMMSGLTRLLSSEAALVQSPEDRPAKGDAQASSPERRLEVLETLLRLRDLRSEYLPGEIFADPAWFMVIDVALTQRQGKRISVSGLCMSSGISQTSALRRVQELVSMGFLVRKEDPEDKRRVYLELSSDTAARLDGLLDRFLD